MWKMSPPNKIILFMSIAGLYLFGDAKVILRKFQNCDQNESYKIKFNFTFQIEANQEYMDGTFVISAPLDNHIRVNVTVDMLLGNRYVYLFTINERKTCDAWNKYLGEIWYDIQRNAQMIPGLCPLSPGRYHLHHCLLNFDKMTTLKNFPFGNLRFTGMLYDSKNNVYDCVLIQLENNL